MVQDWNGKNNYINQPFFMLPRIVKKLKQDKAWATIIAQYWPTQSWCQQLIQMSRSVPINIPNNRWFIKQSVACPEPLKKQKLEDFCLESLWRGRLHREKWLENAVNRLLCNWAPSTLFSYNIQIKQFTEFCAMKGCGAEKATSAILSEFMCMKHLPQSDQDHC